MRMTRQHFKLIAEVIQEISPVDIGQRIDMAQAFARALARTNPAFDRTKFMDAAVLDRTTAHEKMHDAFSPPTRTLPSPREALFGKEV